MKNAFHELKKKNRRVVRWYRGIVFQEKRYGLLYKAAESKACCILNDVCLKKSVLLSSHSAVSSQWSMVYDHWSMTYDMHISTFFVVVIVSTSCSTGRSIAPQ